LRRGLPADATTAGLTILHRGSLAADWHFRKTNTVTRHDEEVFDAELYALWVGLKAAKVRADEQVDGQPRTVAIFTDSQAALRRIRNDDPGPGQWLARRILHAERQLRQAGLTTEFHWIPGH
jgi:ribonuclease HI